MVQASYEYIEFILTDDAIKGRFMRLFTFHIPHEDISHLAPYEVQDGAVVFSEGEDNALKEFERHLSKAMHDLTNKLTGLPAWYIHAGSGVPLFGSNAFGIVDRGTNLIEVKPITGCNLDCIYCSVDESRRGMDIVIDPEFLAQGCRELCEYKDCPPYEIHIGTQGEPLLYAGLTPFLSYLKEIPGVETISMDTNGTMLTRSKVDELVDAGLNRFNISLNAFDPGKAKKIAGTTYPVEKISELLAYIPTRCEMTIAPVLLPGINDDDVEEIVRFAGTLQATYKVRVGIQNFLHYKGGRRPVKGWSMKRFYSFLDDLEERYGIPLHMTAQEFGVRTCRAYPIPFRKGETAHAKIIGRGRLPNERLAVARDRIITFTGAEGKQNVTLRITRVKHNVIYGVPVRQ